MEDPGHRPVAALPREGLGLRPAAGDMERHRLGALGAGHRHVAHRPAVLGVDPLLPGQQPAVSSISHARREKRTEPRPSVKRPVKPAPTARVTRPGASDESVRGGATVATGARRPGTTTPTPRPIRLARAAARARVAKGSC